MKLANKTTTVILLTALLAVSVTAQNSGSYTEINASLVNTEPFPLQSGEQGDLRFEIVNEGDTDAENLEVKLLDNYPFSVMPDRKRNYEFESLTPGQVYQIATEVTVADDAPDGSNDFRVRIITAKLNRTVNIPVEVQSQDIELNLANIQTRPKQLMPDTDNNQISIDLVNNGEKEAENLVVNLETPGFFEQTSSLSTRKALGNLNPGERKTADFTFDLSEETPAGDAEFSAITTYSADDSTSRVEKEEDFSLSIEGKPQFSITDVESDLRTGSTRQLRLKVKNRGDEKSSSTRIRVMDSSDQPFSYDSSSQYIGTLQPGQVGEAVFQVDTESGATVKDYLIDFEIRGVKDTEVFVEDETVEAEVSNGQDSGGNPGIPVTAGVLAAIAVVLLVFRKRVRNRLGI